jgi:hypothetical protein
MEASRLRRAEGGRSGENLKLEAGGTSNPSEKGEESGLVFFRFSPASRVSWLLIHKSA